MKAVLLIALEGEGRALPLARVTNPRLLAEAARSVIGDKRREADDLSRQDTALGVCAREELARIERTLGALIVLDSAVLM